jgi:hypothetical protein
MTGDPERAEEHGSEDVDLEVDKDTIKDLDPQDTDDVKGGGHGWSHDIKNCG